MSLLTSLAVSNNRKNRTRSILIILSIVLSTLLLTVIATWGYGLMKSSRVNADKLYGSYYGAYRGVTEEQLSKMKLRSEFSDIGLLSFMGEIDISDVDLYLFWVDETAKRLGNMQDLLEAGTYPQADNEIAGPKAFFEKLGYISPKVGDTIVIDYRVDFDSKYKPGEFVISGLLKDNELSDLKNRFSAYVSDVFFNQRVKAADRDYDVYFRLNDTVQINYNTAEATLKDLAVKCGINEDKTYANTLYLMWALDPGTQTILVCAVIAVLVIAFSVIVIYNIFQVGITQKIQEYGKLKAIGATRKQLKSVVYREGMLLAVIGIPLGLVIGYLFSVASFGWFLKQADTMRQGREMIQVSLFSFPILLTVAFLSVMTVWITLKRPMKIVAAVSTIEAIRYQESRRKNKGIRRGKAAIDVKGMTFANLSGNRKRTVATICTMGLSCVLFVILTNVVGNMDEEFETRRTLEYGQFCISLDYSMNDKAYPENNLENILKINPLNQEVLEKIKAIEGVTKVKTRNILAAQKKSPSGEATITSISVLSKEDFENLKYMKGYIGTLDYDKAVKQNSIYFGWSHFMQDDGYTLNQNIRLDLLDTNGKITFEGKIPGSFDFFDTDWAITEDTYKKLGFKNNITGYIWIDCEKKNVNKVRVELDKLIAGIDHTDITTYQDELRVTQLGMNMLKMGVYIFLAIIGLIGFMNMANTIITSIITRKQEFGVLQAIGMTNKQLNRMLQLEGLIFTVGTVLIALAVGTPVGYLLFSFVKKTGMTGINIYHFPIRELGIMVASIAILQILLSYILSRNVKKDSLVERIRYQE